MRRAFTMIELLFVIVVVGIIVAIALPRFDRDNLHEAADQVVSHIRYTQHLAMQDDKFNPNDRFWYKGRWTIRFYENLTFGGALPPARAYNGIWAYTIYSDLPNPANPNPYAGHNPDLAGMATNPQNPNQFLSGGYNNTLHVEDGRSMKELRLQEHYDIQDIDFSGGCRSNVTYIHFDYMGRPMNSFPNNSPYEIAAPGWHRLITQRCTISLCITPCATATDDEKIQIAIEPETGYTHIL